MTERTEKNGDTIANRRIANGGGQTPADVNRVLNQYREVNKMMQAMVTGKGPGGLMRLLGM